MMPSLSIRGEKMRLPGQKKYEPFNPDDDPRSDEWVGEDHTDECIPPIPGFISDYVLFNRGREQASAYGVWSALYLISSVMQRDGYLGSSDGDNILDRDWLNLYMLFIGPAGCGKSRAIDGVQKVLKAVNVNLRNDPDPNIKKKDCMFVADASTPEAMLSAMAKYTQTEEPGQRRQVSGIHNGDKKDVDVPTNVNALLSEFASLLGKSKYLESMSTHLLALFDCPTVYDWATRHSGDLGIPEVFFNILGASTADGMMSAVSPTIMQDGFMSRMIMVNVDSYPRSRPIRYSTICDRKDIVERLTWIAKNCDGGYNLTREATVYFKDWYNKFMQKMNEDSEKAGYLIRNRGLILKIAALLVVSEYSRGTEIEVRHLKAASNLITWTYDKVSELIGYMTDKQVGAAMKAIVKFASLERGGITRRQLAHKIKRFGTETTDNAIYTLWLQGEIKLVNEKGELSGEVPKYYPQERYEYERLRHNTRGFEPRSSGGLPEEDKGPVYASGAGVDDSDLDEEESVGNILGFAGIGD
jgi:hypothetical protein